MARIAVPPHRLIRTTTVFTIVPAVVVIATAALGHISLGVAALILLFLIAGTAGVVWLFLLRAEDVWQSIFDGCWCGGRCQVLRNLSVAKYRFPDGRNTPLP